ncbi:hypothetical protein OJ997_25065 [Solirubrobacter phytolaccae]|uniref:LppX_LprAFG lipoprotein n=1 Tax=Solirubrobacter phytolaccae TaxID=1404360 RepID=A0A9X3S9P1_9ACTN|nr:hypothetical protein [Solirubrobacter phytolaccae]MDA0183604.1 hypothetical protein [Solirubrobacter phytolaccae]
MRPVKLIVAGSILAGVAVAIVAGVFLISGDGALARAADRLEHENAGMDIRIETIENGERTVMRGSMVRDATGRRGFMEVQSTFEGQGTIEQNILAVGEDVWIEMPEITHLLPEGKRWVHMVEQTAMVETLTLPDFIDFLRESDTVENLGESTAGGRKLTHYRGKLSAKDLADRIGGETDANFERLLGRQDLLAPVDAWIGDDGSIEKVTMSAEAGGSKVTSHVENVAFGVPADFRPPPEREVVSEEEFNRAMEADEA